MFERLDSRFDVLTQVLNAVHLGSALSARTELRAPWALHFGGADLPRAGFHVVAKGRCWASLDNTGEHVALSPGDVVVFPHGTGHTLGDHPATPAVEFGDLVDGLSPGERVSLPSGGSGDPTTLICGAYSFSADGANPLLRGLPDLLHVPADQSRGGALDAAWFNCWSPRPATSTPARPSSSAGSSTFCSSTPSGPGSASRTTPGHPAGSVRCRTPWWDRLSGRCTTTPPRLWTVAGLAQRSGLSRAAFTRRFREAVGEPPLTYVARWRMTVARGPLRAGRSDPQRLPEGRLRQRVRLRQSVQARPRSGTWPIPPSPCHVTSRA